MNYSTFDTLTVGQYQQLYAIQKSEMDEIDRATESVAVLTGKTPTEVEDMPLSEFNKVAVEIAVIFDKKERKVKPPRSLRIQGRKHRILYNPREISSGQYIDLQHFLSQDTIENLHKIVACLIVPVKWHGGNGKYSGTDHEIKAAYVQEMNFLKIQAVFVFFSKLWSASIKAIQPYLEREMKKKGIQGMNLQELMDGFLAPSR